jgi:trans-aconitate 2-methyltransferase
MTLSNEWDAAAYQRLSEPQFAWGVRVLEGLELVGDETVIDAGCGSGRLTALVAARVPSGCVTAVDRSANMIDEARARLAALGDRVRFVCADLTLFEAPRPADVVFSTATFHWILDHPKLFANLHRALRGGGRLHAQCGGAGNLARFLVHVDAAAGDPRFAAVLVDFTQTWNFATAEQTAERLRGAGFADVTCDLEDAPTPFADRSTFAEFLRVVVLRSHLAALPEGLRDAFVEAVVARALAEGPPALDYVRLNLRATRA